MAQVHKKWENGEDSEVSEDWRDMAEADLTCDTCEKVFDTYGEPQKHGVWAKLHKGEADPCNHVIMCQ